MFNWFKTSSNSFWGPCEEDAPEPQQRVLKVQATQGSAVLRSTDIAANRVGHWQEQGPKNILLGSLLRALCSREGVHSCLSAHTHGCAQTCLRTRMDVHRDRRERLNYAFHADELRMNAKVHMSGLRGVFKLPHVHQRQVKLSVLT